MSVGLTWLKSIPIELDMISENELRQPVNKIDVKDHLVGELSIGLRKLYTLMLLTEESAMKKMVEVRFSSKSIDDDPQMLGSYKELQYKGEALRNLFWIGVNAEHNLWQYESIGVRRDWSVVWSDPDPNDQGDVPPFFRKLMGM